MIERTTKFEPKGSGHGFNHVRKCSIGRLPGDMDVPEHVEDAAVLADYAVMSRYPSASEPVEEEELLEAVGLAGRVLSWARANV